MAKLDLTITATDKASPTLSKLNRQAGGLGKTLGKGLKIAALGAGAGLGVLGAIGFKAVQAAAEQQRVEAQLAQVLKSTGGAAGLTAQQIKDMASGLQKVTTYGDEAILAGQNILLTFTKIGKDVFPDASEVMLDMSTALGQDMKSSAIQLGKALNDPITGMTALRRVGVSFTDAQEKQVKAMMAAGDTMGAQKLILKELQTEFGGSARAAADTFGGRLKQLQNVVGDMLEVIGFALLPIITKLAQALTAFLLDHKADIDRFAKLIGKVVTQAVEFLGTQLTRLIGTFRRDVLPILRQVTRILQRTLVPALKTLTKFVIDSALPAMEKLFRFIKDNKPVLAGVGAAIVAVMVPALVAWTAATWAHVTALAAQAIAFAAANAPLIAIAAGIGVVVAGIVLLIQHWGEIKTFVNNILSKFQELPIIGEIFEAVRAVVQDKIEAVIGIVQGLIDFAGELISFFKHIFKGEWGAAWTDLKDMAKIALQLFLDWLDLTFIGTFKSLIRVIDPWSYVQPYIIGPNGFVPQMKAAFDTVIGFVMDIPSRLQTYGQTFFNAGKGLFKRLANGAIEAVNGLINGFIGGLNAIIKAWNDFSIEFPGLKVAGKTIVPGFSVDTPNMPTIPVPQIPTLQGGGKVLRTGLAMVHEGERFSGSQGGAFEIDYDRLAAAVARALLGVRVEMDGHEIGRLQGQRAFMLSRGG